MKKYEKKFNLIISARRAGMTYEMTMYLIDTLEEMIHSLRKRYVELLVKVYILKLIEQRLKAAYFYETEI